ncbi:unnamed protein product, partial [Dovyalis caffra]
SIQNNRGLRSGDTSVACGKEGLEVVKEEEYMILRLYVVALCYQEFFSKSKKVPKCSSCFIQNVATRSP